MELNRLARIARARWWLFGVIGALGLFSAIVLTSFLNRRIEPRFEATATLAVIPDPGGDTNDLESKTLDVLDAALLTNQERVARAQNRIELAVDEVGLINFISVSSTAEDAADKAQSMRVATEDDLRAQATTLSSQNRAQQELIRSRLAQIEDEIRELELSRPEVDTQTVIDLQLKQANFNAIATELNARYVERVTGVNTVDDPNRTMADVEIDIAALEAEYRRLQGEILSDTRSPGNQQFNEIDREISLLTQEYGDRIAEYGDLVLAAATADTQSLGAAEVLDVTATPGSAVTNGAAGLIAGLLIAFGLLMVHDRYRQIVWIGSDMVTLPYLGEVVQRAAPVVAGQAWYEFGGPAQRKRAIQSIRVTVESASVSGSALGVTGLAPSQDLHELAADFAMSMVTSGSRVALVDADFERPSVLFEFSGSGATLSDLLQFRLEDEESYRAYIKRSLTEQDEVVDGLTAVPVGHGIADPADALSGRRLQILVEEVRRMFDLAIFVTGSGVEAVSLATMNRMDGVIIAIRPGQATRAKVEEAHRQLAAFGVPVLGGALLTRAGRESTATLPAADPVIEPPSHRRTAAAGADAQDLLVEALLRERSRSEPPPPAEDDDDDEDDMDTAASAPAPSAGTRPRRPGDAGRDLPARTEAPNLVLVSALAPTSAADPSEAVAALLSDTIEQVLRGFAGGSTPRQVDPGIAEVTKFGFVPMVRVKGHKTIGARVLDALNARIESAERSQLIDEMVAFFAIEEGGRSNERVVTAINEWARTHYFTRHLVDTGREPTVWHVASQHRTFEGLVHVNRCTKERIDLFRSEILRRQLDALNKSLKAASKARRTEQVRVLEERIKDLRTFDIAWGWLFEGTTPAARLWYPWKGPEMQPQGWDPNLDEGVRANIAPLQRLGVLAQDVLTGEELLALSPPS